MNLKKKTAIVTGAGRGLGRSIAETMASQGAAVVLVSRTRKQLQEVADTIHSNSGQALASPVDIRDEKEISKMVETTYNTFGSIDILVNNAGIIGPANFLNPENEKAWLETMDINLNGTWRCTQAVIPYMMKNKTSSGGKIINVVSGLGNRPFPRFCAYAASKAGMIQMTRSLSLELAPANIQINAIDPGVMDTPMQSEIRSMGRDQLGDDIFERFSKLHENNLLKDPNKVAALALFLASKQADHLTGETGTLDQYAEKNDNFSVPD